MAPQMNLLINSVDERKRMQKKRETERKDWMQVKQGKEKGI